MDWQSATLGALGLVAVATALGLFWRSRDGRARTVADALAVVRPADVASVVSFGEFATLLQFSTELCARCPQTHTLLSSLARHNPGVVHVDVDLTHRADIAKRFNVLQTPTILVLDDAGVVRTRIGGAPHRHTVQHHLDLIARSDHRANA
ncbi:thioredoxin family protein [Luethyella okanaganae]|uniref:Thioredoxin family protein n=1 Tax=Luethyella okanaganae TaxID=69372 RepID=A0ABW1VGM4_9MICO